MKKLLIIITLVFTLSGCDIEKKNLDTWLVGGTKQKLYLSWGPPTRTTTDGDTGEILIYDQDQRGYDGSNFTHRTMFYVRSDGKIYTWKVYNTPIAPIEVHLTN